MALTRPKYSQIYDSDFKNSARVATSTNVTLAGAAPSSVDGVSLNVKDRVLVRSQNTASQNGIYMVTVVGTGSNGTWVRALDADTASKLSPGTTLTVEEGSLLAGKLYRMTSTNPITLGSTAITWTDVSGGGGAAGGNNAQIQYNDTNAFGGATYFWYDETNGKITANGGIASTSTTTGTMVVTGGVGISGNLIAGGHGQFSGLFNESTAASGVFIGNTGIGVPSPRIGFFNGNTTQNWQVDNFSGVFRWFTPGVTRMSLYENGNLSIPSTSTATSTTTGALVVGGGAGIGGELYVGANVTVTGNVLPSANVTYNLGSPSQRWKDLYLSGTTINLNGATISATAGAITFQNSLGGSFAVTGSAGGQSTGTFGNLVANSGIASSSTSTGALVVGGGAGISGALNVGGDVGIGGALNVGGDVGIGGDVVITGGLTVNGTTTNINTTNLVVEDKNIIIADVATPSDTTADGGGITVKGTTDKTFTWVDATDAWTSSEHVNLATGKEYYINGNSVLNSTTLGSGVTASSLTSVGILTSLRVGAVTSSGTVIASTVNAGTIGNSGAVLTGTISTAAQTNITSVGNLTSLSVVGTSSRGGKALVTNYTGNVAPANPAQGDEWYKADTDILYKYIYDGVNYQWVDLTSPLYNASTSATANTLALRDSGGNITAVNFLGTASSARYADLAEIYVPDNIYEPGTVVVFGGEKEITTTNLSHDPRVAGVISTNPAYLMNSECTGLPVAFTGRVPCQVQGPVTKGQLLVTSAQPGVAQAIDAVKFVPGCVVGKSLENIITNEITTIEVVVGRF